MKIEGIAGGTPVYQMTFLRLLYRGRGFSLLLWGGRKVRPGGPESKSPGARRQGAGRHSKAGSCLMVVYELNPQHALHPLRQVAQVSLVWPAADISQSS